MSDKDFFRERYKYFKQKHNPKVLRDVINFDSHDTAKSVTLLKDFTKAGVFGSCPVCMSLGLVPHPQWQIYSLKNFDGFFYIRNPFTIKGQQHWIRKCIEEYPRKPSLTNLDLHYKDIDDIWCLQEDADPVKRKLTEKLTWATLGYNYNWDAKIYDRNKHSSFPGCLSKLTQHIASCLHFNSFQPEAAIVNYYGSKSKLGIHNDHSEEELGQPIVSVSFGQTAIFLIGTECQTEMPMPVFLRSGDIVLLSGACRLSYHAVPAIIHEPVCNRYCTSNDGDTWKPFYKYIKRHRINLSVRQVYPHWISLSA